MSEAVKIKIKNKNEDVLLGLAWTVQEPIANVIIMEGMEEHVSRYDDFAKYLNKENFNVYAIDTYGQGLNVKEDMSNVGLWPTSGFRKPTLDISSLTFKP